MNVTDINADPCPCGSGQAFSACCGPYHRAEKNPATAEQLMRSRYSAYVLDEFEYLADSWHSSTRPKNLAPNETGLVWQGLEIVATDTGQPGDEHGEVEFIARLSIDGKPAQIHERSRFVREDGKWRYLDGNILKGAPLRTEKTGRNSPCPCGSGKKYKRCCM